MAKLRLPLLCEILAIYSSPSGSMKTFRTFIGKDFCSLLHVYGVFFCVCLPWIFFVYMYIST